MFDRIRRDWKTTKRWGVFALAVGLVACSSSTDSTIGAQPPTIAATGDAPESLQDDLNDALADVMARFDVPGAVVAVATPQGSWTAEAGVADIETAERASAEMMWPLRSLTKSFTVTALLQLADEGALELDDSIARYVDG